MSYFTQMAGLAYHNFTSAAVGIALAIAFIRGIARRQMRPSGTSGWTWCAPALGAAANLHRRRTGAGVAGRGSEPEAVRHGEIGRAPTGAAGRLRRQPRAGCQRQTGHGYHHTQTIAQGPVASQEIIKEWGTNGGGFFNANSAHPFENPTPLSNLIEIFCIFAMSARAHLHAGTHDRLDALTDGPCGRRWRSCFLPA